MDPVRLSRTRLYPSPGTNYRVAWKWLYDVNGPDGTFLCGGYDRLSIARRFAKAHAKRLGVQVVESWKG